MRGDSVKELARKIKLNRLQQYYIPVLDFLVKRKVILYKEIINNHNFTAIRAVLYNLAKYGIVARHKTNRGTLYIATTKTKRLLELLLNDRKKVRVIDPRMIINWGVFKWVLQGILLLHKEGYTKFSKGLFFNRLYQYMDQLEKEGYLFERPKLVSLDRSLRYAVEWGILERQGSHQRPIYVINTEKLEEVLKLWE